MIKSIEEKYLDVLNIIKDNPGMPTSTALKKARIGNGTFYKLAGIKSLAEFDQNKHSTPKQLKRKRRAYTYPSEKTMVDELADKLAAQVLRKIYQKLGV